MCKGMAVVLAKGALRRRAHMAEYESRCRLGRDALKICAVPRGNRRCEEARGRAELEIGIEAYAKAVGIVLASSRVLKRWKEGDVS